MVDQAGQHDKIEKLTKEIKVAMAYGETVSVENQCLECYVEVLEEKIIEILVSANMVEKGRKSKEGELISLANCYISFLKEGYPGQLRADPDREEMPVDCKIPIKLIYWVPLNI